MMNANDEKDEPVDPGSQSILNEDLLAQYREMDARMSKDRMLPRLFQVFEKNFPEYIAKLIEGLETQNPEQVNHFVHKMLGMSHNIGALRLSQILLHWEQTSLENKMRIDTHALDQIRNEFKIAESALEQYLEEWEH
ncbi:MAG TPA: Hpt domain-containing protein [Oligoflexus sp.]|uniref:Hpt domain-containing protein n=1 Tax=Oligoflexus sp. TaxID=1971216 RepID=UPI002D806F41|nr:Hpt domain-containing protein [Oligoflexus sp.]HET9240064.1 Hpt domain-containing protein [Oligoflexus sp.]